MRLSSTRFSRQLAARSDSPEQPAAMQTVSATNVAASVRSVRTRSARAQGIVLSSRAASKTAAFRATGSFRVSASRVSSPGSRTRAASFSNWLSTWYPPKERAYVDHPHAAPRPSRRRSSPSRPFWTSRRSSRRRRRGGRTRCARATGLGSDSIATPVRPARTNPSRMLCLDCLCGYDTNPRQRHLRREASNLVLKRA